VKERQVAKIHKNRSSLADPPIFYSIYSIEYYMRRALVNLEALEKIPQDRIQECNEELRYNLKKAINKAARSSRRKKVEE
jgi:hypothetical protein